MKSIEERWVEFASMVCRQSGQAQRDDMRVAFYAGFFSSICAAEDLNDEFGNDDAGRRAFKRLWDECHRFFGEMAEQAWRAGR